MSKSKSLVERLEEKWQPVKDQLKDDERGQNLRIRMHRCFSWMKSAQQHQQAQDYDSVLLANWIAFNGLYGQWDAINREPKPDIKCWKDFIDQIIAIDDEGSFNTLVENQRELILDILDNEYINKYFWEDPTEAKAFQSKKDHRSAATWYRDKKYDIILKRALGRVYVLRCQMMHGGATHGSKLNRDSIALCADLIQNLLPVIITIITRNGKDQNWGAICYPPID